MTTTNKNRAGRNRTVTLTEQERETLGRLISDADSLKAGFRDDMVINADMMECIDDIPDAHFDLAIIDPPKTKIHRHIDQLTAMYCPLTATTPL